MKYCKKCLQPDTRPNTTFTDDGICPACNYFHKLGQVDWQERTEILLDIAKDFPRKIDMILIVLLELVEAKIVFVKQFLLETSLA